MRASIADRNAIGHGVKNNHTISFDQPEMRFKFKFRSKITISSLHELIMKNSKEKMRAPAPPLISVIASEKRISLEYPQPDREETKI